MIDIGIGTELKGFGEPRSMVSHTGLGQTRLQLREKGYLGDVGVRGV
jgi:hypothetical protein